VARLLGERYDIVELLGIGGMGAVYKAHDRELDRVVALKFIRPELADNAETLQRFKQEIILAREVTHRNVVRIYDFGESDGTKFVSMEFIEGESLANVLKRRGKLPSRDATAIMHQVFEGLAAAHARHVVHRDLKPGNIMRDREGRIVIMDFGLARHESGESLTHTGAMVGTIDYMRMERPPRTDGARLGFRATRRDTLPYQFFRDTSCSFHGSSTGYGDALLIINPQLRCVAGMQNGSKVCVFMHPKRIAGKHDPICPYYANLHRHGWQFLPNFVRKDCMRG